MATRKKTPTVKAPKAPPKPLVERAKQIHVRLKKTLPHPRCELDHEDPWQLLVATILSAQSTDAGVNRVTPVLFGRWPTPAALGDAEQEDVEQVIKSTGFFRNKAKSIRAASRMVAAEFGGEVPRDMDSILTLPGVARKTANVVLGTGYGVASGIAVDTHAIRVSQRLGLTTHKDPTKIEPDLCALFPERAWIDTGHRIVLHGRYVCLARTPRCEHCPLNELCPSRQCEPEGRWTERAKWENTVITTRAR